MNNLDEIKKQYGKAQPFRVPDNYFEQFSAKIMEGLPDKEIKEVKKARVISLRSRIRTVMYVAAMLAMAIWTTNSLLREHATTSSTEVSIKANDHENDAVSIKLAMSVDEYSLCEYLSDEEY